MLSWFENLVDPYPAEPPKAPPKGFWAFLWAGTQGMRRYLLGMTLLTASIGAFEALLFSMLGSIVGGPEVMQVVVYPIVLFMASMFHTSLWFTVRDSFAFDAPEPDASPSA